jgi:molybdenum cofactor cytidylyltransferase
MARTFAVVPAAGHSTRMGEPKLLLPLAGEPLIWHTIRAWQRSQVDQIVVVVRPGDERLAEVVCRAGAILVTPAVPPPDMKTSIQAALRHIDVQFSPVDADAFLFAPADMPRLSPAIIGALIKRYQHEHQRILVPTITGQRGHPVLFPWPLAAEVHALAENEGLDAIVRSHEPLRVACDEFVAAEEHPFADIDTPQDYRRLNENT